MVDFSREQSSSLFREPGIVKIAVQFSCVIVQLSEKSVSVFVATISSNLSLFDAKICTNITMICTDVATVIELWLILVENNPHLCSGSLAL